ncbi:hypothetical protein GKQ23_09860 [Erwinia sp. E602]|uniref:hypothetical protein n=1 Tax=Erwinia sp. E602 TaxID=2675378 RepID=UPI001BAD605E|nr:hypothetical protein [Erwinia sp. E602]QUG75273.1 hypothetical protein GKQ23_09860 [Erwinia sp. E602]
MQPAWYFPHDHQQLCHFYIVICVSYLVMHVVWDWRSDKTPPFSFSTLKNKADQVFSSVTLASSLFYIVVLLDLTNPLRDTDLFIFSMIFSALCGVLVSLAMMVPYANRYQSRP